MTNKMKAAIGLVIAGTGIYLYSRLTPGEKEKFSKSLRKNGTKYLLQLVSFGLSQRRAGEHEREAAMSTPSKAQAFGQSNAAMVPSVN